MQRTWFFLSVALAAIGAALFLNLAGPILGTAPDTYLNPGEVEGMAVMRNGILYTVGFDQQQKLIELINQAVPVEKKEVAQGSKPNFSKFVIYRFRKPKEMFLDPVVYDKNNLVFTLSGIYPEQYLREGSGGEFKRLIQEIIDRNEIDHSE